MANPIKALMADPRTFRASLLVDTDRGPLPLGEVADPWQVRDFEALDPAWRRVCGHDVGEVRSRAFLERPRGHSKTSDTAAMVLWALFASSRSLRGIAAAADRDQAKLIRDAIARLLALNPWLSKVIEIQTHSVVNKTTKSVLTIISSDAATSFGLTPDFVIADELVHWQGDALWLSLFSAAAKRSHCLLLVITNAGTGAGSAWQWTAREAARVDPRWYFSRLDGPQASWIDEATLAEQERMLPPAAYKRLWLNLWQTGQGDALPEDDIEAALTCRRPQVGNEPGFTWLAGLDLSTTSDRSALVVVGAHAASQRVRVAHVQTWKPISGRIDLEAVAAAVHAAHQRFNLASVHYDPYQAVLMAQQLRRRGLNTVEMPFVGANLVRMATATLNAFRNRAIDLFEDRQLIADLRKLVIVEKSFGWKLEAARDRDGHADTAFALAIVLPAAMELASHGFTGEFQQATALDQPEPGASSARFGVQVQGSWRGAGRFFGSALNRPLNPHSRFLE